MLSNSAKIVIIDDKYSEIEILIKALSKAGTPFIYLDGIRENLPNALAGVRFLFLDIELSDTIGIDPKGKASALVAKIKFLLGENPGPYFIVFWTGHPDTVEFVLEYLKTAKISPVAHVDLEKPNKDDFYLETIDTISNRIRERLKDIGAFEFYVQWENMVNQAAMDFVDKFSTIVKNDGNVHNWSSATEQLLGNLSKNYYGKKELSGIVENDLKGAVLTLNTSFSDSLEKYSNELTHCLKSFSLKDGSLSDIKVAAEINNRLFFDFHDHQYLKIGSVFLTDDIDLKAGLRSTIFKTPPTEMHLCYVVITPECDYSNDKLIVGSTSKGKVHRIIYGLLFPWEKSEKELNKLLEEKGKDARFFVGPFLYNQKPYIIFIHFGTISFLWKNGNNDDVLIFSIRRELIFDLQSKAANHVNRLGNSLLKYSSSESTRG